MDRFFGLPVMAAIGAGLLFPYTAISLLPLGFAFLFLLMLLAGFSIDWRKLSAMRGRPLPLLLGLGGCFLFFPLLQLLLARLVLTDAQFQVGLVFSALMPVAMVAPFFTSLLGGDEETAFLLMVLSMLLAPFVAPALLGLLATGIVPIPVAPFMKSMLLLVTVPLLVSFGISRTLPRVRAALVPHLGLANMAALSVLIFILFGTIAGRVNVGYEARGEILLLLLLAFVQDFGVYFGARLLLVRMLPPRDACALNVSLAMKNVAIAAGILLFHDPRAALAPALVFIAHACLFSFLPSLKRFLAVEARER